MKPRSSRTGLILFTVYLVFYAGFIAINAFAPDSMEKPLFSGLNVAVVYGFALIVGAVVMSAIYGMLCGDLTGSANDGDKNS